MVASQVSLQLVHSPAANISMVHTAAVMPPFSYRPAGGRLADAVAVAVVRLLQAATNNSDKNRIILICDIERKMKWR